MTVILESGVDFTLDALRRVAWDGEPVELGGQALERIGAAHDGLLRLVEREPDLHVYGLTTGFGDGARRVLGVEERARLAVAPPQVLAAGVGERLPDRVVRAMIFTRLVNFVSGFSAVSVDTARQVADLLDGRPLPVVRCQGQDSPGELLQLLNLFRGLDRDRFQPGDHNAITNGAGCAPGLIGDVALRARRRVVILTQVLALSVDAGAMSLDPYDPALRMMMGDAEEGAAIDALSTLLVGIDTRGRRDYQNPISWRILTRMVGQVLRAVAGAERAARTALSRVSDNPVFLNATLAPPHGRVISTGGFHSPDAYHAMNALSAIWAEIAVLAAIETKKLHLADVTGLAPGSMSELQGGGTRLLTISAYDIASRAREHAVPALTPLYEAGDVQTDVVMPLFLAFEKETAAARCLDRCLAILAATASQALSVAGRDPAPALRPFLADVRTRFAPISRDLPRDVGAEAQQLADDLHAAILGQVDAFGMNRASMRADPDSSGS
jgi:histidine ammonia-lyase